MQKILFRITKDLFPQVKDRYPYIYLEHGRLEVDDSSIKWISAQNEVIRIPIAVINSLFLGPGTSVTHTAISSISAAGCTVCWVGEESVKFYAFGMPPTADTRNLYWQLQLAMDEEKRVEVARRMFARRFAGADLEGKSLQAMMGMEGQRVRALYADKAVQYGIHWGGRSYIPGQSDKSEPVNKVLTFANSILYGVLTSAILAAGYTPRVGFIHSGSPMPFVYDVADLYKADLTIDLAFRIVAEQGDFKDRHVVIDAFCQKLIELKVLQRIVPDIESVLGGA